MLIIPAIDIIEGKCVRLEQGKYNARTVYNENPLDVARQFEENGITHLHLVDLDGAKNGRIINLNVLETIASKTSLIIDFGGGIKTDEDVKAVFDAGAQRLTAGSIAVKDKELVKRWIKKYGAEKIILGADVKDEKIAVSGWQETSSEDLFNFLKSYTSQGIRYVICTDIRKDGMLQGASIELYKNILERFPGLDLIASGGITGIEELERLKKAGLYGAIVGKAIYENRITLEQIRNFINKK
jgi:phosphoribosylformimino-5-aminoimidazole carboxamide ribotide isomerase